MNLTPEVEQIIVFKRDLMVCTTYNLGPRKANVVGTGSCSESKTRPRGHARSVGPSSPDCGGYHPYPKVNRCRVAI